MLRDERNANVYGEGTITDKAAAVLDALSPWPETCPKCGSAATPARLGDGRLQALCSQRLAVFWNRDQAIRVWRAAVPYDMNPPWDSILLAET